jgi:hypothetical protein
VPRVRQRAWFHVSEQFTLVPGDRVRFAGHEWEVFVTPRGDQRDDTPIVIFRAEHPDCVSPMIDLVRQRCDLRLIPRAADADGSASTEPKSCSPSDPTTDEEDETP